MVKKWILSKKTPWFLILFTLLSLSFIIIKSHYFKLSHDIAITIDDLPFISASRVDDEFNSQCVERMIDTLVKHHAPAIGFVIAERLEPALMRQIEGLQKNGFQLGNHTYSHPNLRHMDSQTYLKDIARADVLLKPIISKPKYFRYPYLTQEKWWQKKPIRDYLDRENYTVAPVTIDSRDFEFNNTLLNITHNATYSAEKEIIQLKQQYVDFIWQQTVKRDNRDKWSPITLVGKKHILLLHANFLNSIALDDLLTMYEKHGYRFVTLQDALEAR